MKNWIALLLAFLTLGAGEPGDDAGLDAGAAEGGAGEGDQGTGDDTLDDLIELSEGGAGSQAADGGDAGESAAIKEARRRADTAENIAANERSARQAAEARAAPQQQYRDQEFEAENAEYAAAQSAGSTKEQLEWLAWKIQSNRAMRNTQRASTFALAQAQDISDKAAFDRLEITKPHVYKRYAQKVESAVMELRRNGNNAPRNLVLRMLLGDDIMNGNVKPKARGAAAANTGVDRGRTTGARSDVGGKGGKLTEHQKRTARLENQRI